MHWRKLSDKPLFPQEQVFSMQHNRFLLLLLQSLRLGPGGLSIATLRPNAELRQALGMAWRGSGFSGTSKAEM